MKLINIIADIVTNNSNIFIYNILFIFNKIILFQYICKNKRINLSFNNAFIKVCITFDLNAKASKKF